MNKIYSFMYGRNGSDQLNVALLFAALALNIIYRLTAILILTYLANIAVVFVIFRMFSKNLPKRQAENRKFVYLWSDTKKEFSDWRTRKSQSKDFKFFNCPSCKNTLRVPRGKGKIQITCPKCGQRFSGKS